MHTIYGKLSSIMPQGLYGIDDAIDETGYLARFM
jgi:hypothetical protein